MVMAGLESEMAMMAMMVMVGEGQDQDEASEMMRKMVEDHEDQKAKRDGLRDQVLRDHPDHLDHLS